MYLASVRALIGLGDLVDTLILSCSCGFHRVITVVFLIQLYSIPAILHSQCSSTPTILSLFDFATLDL